jgi:hypothetical protein
MEVASSCKEIIVKACGYHLNSFILDIKYIDIGHVTLSYTIIGIQ